MLEGLVVLEMGAGSAPGAFAGMLFADYGARVIKVEPPEGDRLRTQRPAAHLVWDRGKESMVIDLRMPQGQDELRGLADEADVVLEGFGLGVADGWGVGYESLSTRNPALVYCDISGFGRSGGYSQLPAYEGVVRAKTGHFDLGQFGFRSGPTYNDALMASTGTGHLAFAGSLAALTVREDTGRGQLVEAMMVQGLVAQDYFGVAMVQHMAKLAAESGEGDANENPISKIAAGASRLNFTCPTSDGRWVNFTHMMPRQAQALSKVLGIAECIEDPKYAPQPFFETPEIAQSWEDMCWDALRTKTYAEWEPLLLAEDNIAFEMARTSEEGLDHAQIIANGEAVTLDDPEFGPIRQVGPVAQVRDRSHGPFRSAPRLGESGGPIEASLKPEGGSIAPEHPLSHTTIIELGYFYAMPYGVTLIAANGARVIKIEALTGDPMRDSFLFPDVGGAKTMEGKESLSIDLSTEEGRSIMHQLAARADVFVNGFRPGVAERLDLGEETIRAINPNILFVHASGYGVEGPYAHRPIYAGVASAVAGQITRHGGNWLDPELTMSLDTTAEAQAVVLPRIRGPVDGDANAALAVFSTIALGVFHRRRTGEGSWMSTTMIGGNAMAYSDDFVAYADKQPLPVADPDMNGLSALYRLYPAKSGWVFVAATSQREWESLAQAIGGAELVGDARFATDEARGANDGELSAAVGGLLEARDAQDWEDLLAPQGIAIVKAFEGPHSAFTIGDPVMRETGLTVEVESPIFGPILRAAAPLRFSETPGRNAPGCALGQHTRSILAELGYDNAAVDQLIDKGVVGERK